jgi:hypothetical protein
MVSGNAQIVESLVDHRDGRRRAVPNLQLLRRRRTIPWNSVERFAAGSVAVGGSTGCALC